MDANTGTASKVGTFNFASGVLVVYKSTVQVLVGNHKYNRVKYANFCHIDNR